MGQNLLQFSNNRAENLLPNRKYTECGLAKDNVTENEHKVALVIIRNIKLLIFICKKYIFK